MNKSNFYIDQDKRRNYTHDLTHQNFPLYEDKVALVYRLQQALVMGLCQLELVGRTGILNDLDQSLAYTSEDKASISFNRGEFSNIIGPKAHNVAVISSIRTLTRMIEDAAASASSIFVGNLDSCAWASDEMCSSLITSCIKTYMEKNNMPYAFFEYISSTLRKRLKSLCFEYFFSSLRASDCNWRIEIALKLGYFDGHSIPWEDVLNNSLKLNSEINFYTFQNFVYDCKAYYYRKTNQGASKEKLALLMNKEHLRKAFGLVSKNFELPRKYLNKTYLCLSTPLPYFFFFSDKPKGYINPML